MSKSFLLKLLLIILLGIAFVSLVFAILHIHKLYNSIFRLSRDEISHSLSAITPQCIKISDCNLIPGDILLRRYVTPKTRYFNAFAHPYFTHSAFYLGDDQIVEAVGTEKDPQDEILISTLSKSDWLDSGVESFIIIRPKNSAHKLGIIQTNLKNIAEDPNYRFGLPKPGNKMTTCADIILQELLDEHIITISDAPEIITPDYLFWIGKNNPEDFEIVGVNISREGLGNLNKL